MISENQSVARKKDYTSSFCYPEFWEVGWVVNLWCWRCCDKHTWVVSTYTAVIPLQNKITATVDAKRKVRRSCMQPRQLHLYPERCVLSARTQYIHLCLNGTISRNSRNLSSPTPCLRISWSRPSRPPPANSKTRPEMKGVCDAYALDIMLPKPCT